MSEIELKQVLQAMEQSEKALKYAQREMNAVWNYISPNSSNDMEWADEVIIAIEQKVQAALAAQQPQGVDLEDTLSKAMGMAKCGMDAVNVVDWLTQELIDSQSQQP
jgi:hypothetical protein